MPTEPGLPRSLSMDDSYVLSEKNGDEPQTLDATHTWPVYFRRPLVEGSSFKLKFAFAF